MSIRYFVEKTVLPKQYLLHFVSMEWDGKHGHLVCRKRVNTDLKDLRSSTRAYIGEKGFKAYRFENTHPSQRIRRGCVFAGAVVDKFASIGRVVRRITVAAIYNISTLNSSPKVFRESSIFDLGKDFTGYGELRAAFRKHRDPGVQIYKWC